MTQYTLDRAYDYIEKNSFKKNSQYVPKIHFTAPVGWINDPNGFVFFKGEYHLFYQYYPYDSVWGPMHWGHAKSEDLINWEHLPVALAPDQSYDKDGCFSGSAIVKDDKLWLMYTGNILDEDNNVKQVQNMAYSEDGITFTKLSSNPVLDEMDLPDEIISADFRDPKMFKHSNCYFSVIAARHIDKVGCIVLASSKDLVEWKYESIFLKGTPEQGEMWECPDYFNLNDIDTILMSPMRVPKKGLSYHNINSTVVMTGKVNWETLTFELDKMEELDYGHDFYAPQTLEDGNGRRIMIAWQHTWGRRNITKELDHKWAYSMTIPRELSYDNGNLLQKPTLSERLDSIDMIETASLVKISNQSRNNFVIKYGNDEDYLKIYFDAEQHAIYIDRSNLSIKLPGEEKDLITKRGVPIKEKELLSLDLIIDTNSVELFVNGGSGTMASNFYFSPETRPVLKYDGKIDLKKFKLS